MNKANYWLYEKAQAEMLAYLEATTGIGMTERHYALKTSDRGDNPEHCREAIQITMTLPEAKLKKVRARHGLTTAKLLKAVTGRPKVHAKASSKVLAETKADVILNDLRKAAGRQVKAGTYKAGKISHPDSEESLQAEVDQVLAYAEEQKAVVTKREADQAERKAKKASAPKTSKKVKAA